MQNTAIEELCYELYKIDFMRRISPERIIDAKKNWFMEEYLPNCQNILNPHTGEADTVYSGMSFEDWIEDVGYDGEIYVSRIEFFNNDFFDERLYDEYIKIVDLGLEKSETTLLEKKEYVKKKALIENVLSGMDDDCWEFYYKAMHDYDYDFCDVDCYAWLNTLFGYDIGAERARGINRWLYENGQDALELTAKSAGTLKNICSFELGYDLSFDSFAGTTPDAIRYTWNAA